MPSRRVKSNLRQKLIRRDKNCRDEMAREIRAVGSESNKAHKDVVSDWEHKPDFYTTYDITPKRISMNTEARGKNKKIWWYVNQGTKPHIITAVNSPYLVFQKGYNSKTKAVAKAHTGTGVSSGEWVKTQSVNHPGNEARKFTQHILSELRKGFSRRIELAIRRGLRR